MKTRTTVTVMATDNRKKKNMLKENNLCGMFLLPVLFLAKKKNNQDSKCNGRRKRDVRRRG